MNHFRFLMSQWLAICTVGSIQKNAFYYSESPAESRNAVYETVERGRLYDLTYSIYIRGPKGYVSPWHDISLYADKTNNIYNMIVEIPRWTNAKMEMTTREPMAPIRQSTTKSGAPRFVANIFPYHGYMCNYGALPQTWEDVNYIDPHTNTTGDNDPIDVLEIGNRVHQRGAVIQVKILGILGLLDNGETDWKLVALDVSDPLADDVNDIHDVERKLPGLLETLREWLRIYKTPSGAPPNTFAFDGEYQDADFAQEIINKTHDAWKVLIWNSQPSLNTECHVANAAFSADDDKWMQIVENAPPPGAPIHRPIALSAWYYNDNIATNAGLQGARAQRCNVTYM